MTAIADPPAVTAGPPADEVSVPLSPVATLSADLMPDEILVKRRLGYLKRRLVFVMAALVALVVLGDMLVRQQTSSAGAGLAAANDHIASLNTQLNHFSGMLATQSETQAIQSQLDGVMGSDVSWPALLAKVTAPAPAGLHLNSVTAQVDDPNDTGSSATDTTGLVVADQVGSLTLSGTAASWQQVAAYVRGLSAIKGFTAVNPSTVASGAGAPGGSHSSVLTFTVTVDLTSATLSNRYTSTTAPTSSASPATTPASSVGSTTTASTSSSSPAGTTSRHTSSHTASTGAAGNSGRGNPKGSTTSLAAKTKISTSSRHGLNHSHHNNATGSQNGPAQSTQESS